MQFFGKGRNRRKESFRDDPHDHGTDPQDNVDLVDENAPSPFAVIYRSELDYLSRCVLDYPNIETGGQLFGFWTGQGVPVVLYAIGPGENSNHEPSFFNQDKHYLDIVGNELVSRYNLDHIGEWHSHHQLGLARPSGHDARTMHHGLVGIPRRRLLLCICNYENGRSVVNPYNFHENDLRGYADAQWQVIDRVSPFRIIADRELEDILIHPRTTQPSHGRNRIVQLSSQSEPPKIKIPAEYWVAREGGIQTLKSMHLLTKSMMHVDKVDTQADESGIVQFHIPDRSMDIRFPKEFPKVAPEVYVRGALLQLSAEWEQPVDNESIYRSYEKWLTHLSGAE